MVNIQFQPFPVFETERLLIRRLTDNDTEAIFRIRSDKKVNKYIDRPVPSNPNDIIAFIKKINDGIDLNEAIYWVITLKPTQELIGTICLWNIQKNEEKAETGFELLPEHQGKGLMKEALSEILNYGFNTMNLRLIEGYTNPANERSINLMKKFNFSLAGQANEYTETGEKMEIYTLYANQYEQAAYRKK